MQNSLVTLQRHINIKKLQRFHLKEEDLTIELETQRARDYTTAYFEGLPYGVDLPPTETQPADDLAILAVHAYVNMYIISGKQDPLFSAVSLLEHGLTKSKHGFQLRLILIRLYNILCKVIVFHATRRPYLLPRCSLPCTGALSCPRDQAGPERYIIISTIITRLGLFVRGYGRPDVDDRIH